MRAHAMANGWVRYGSHGQCATCDWRERRRSLVASEGAATATYRRSELVEEYRRMRDPDLSRAANCRRLAPRLGMRSQSMERALDRAGVAA